LIFYDPTGTIFRVIVATALSGAAWAGVAACLIYLGSVRLAPRVPPSRVWADWRRKRMIWGLSLMLTTVAAVLLAEALGRRIGLIDIYWMGRADALLWIARLAGTCGYLLLLLLVVVVSLVRRRKAARAPQPPRPKSTPPSK
jgi:hypothetical protein